jgi:hypothetical protein
LLRRRTVRKNLYEFVRQGWAEVEAVPFVDNWHIGAICEHLQAVTAGQIPKLLINVPPGSGKSLLTSVFWPAWEWAIDPSVRWLFASYDSKLSTRDSVRCRALIAKPWYRARRLHKFDLTGDQNQKTYFETDQGGYRLATSIGGHGSGEDPDRIVCDDPHNVQQAESPQERQSVLDWWDLTMSTRGVSRNARRVIIMQRLHQDDLSGHVLADGDWVHLCLPMRYEPGRMPTTPLGWADPRTEEGALLCPAQFSSVAVAQLEKSLGAYGAAGQLQQRPVPREGGMFKESYFNQRVKVAPYHATRVRYWDRAATQDGGCYTAGTLLALSADGNWYVENVVHGQWEPETRDEKIRAAALRDRNRYGPRNEPVIWIEHEPGSSGVDAYKHAVRKLAGFRVCPDRPTGAKEVRAEPWASQCAAKNVYLVEGRHLGHHGVDQRTLPFSHGQTERPRGLRFRRVRETRQCPSGGDLSGLRARPVKQESNLADCGRLAGTVGEHGYRTAASGGHDYRPWRRWECGCALAKVRSSRRIPRTRIC